MIAVAALALAIPLHFEPVRGKTGAAAGFSAVAPRYTLRLTDEGVAMYFRGGAVGLKLPRTRPEGLDELAARSNYYLGSDPAEWRTGIPNYARVRYAHVFPGVDLVVYGRDQQIEYDWIVAPGADPGAIRFSFEGVSGVSIGRDGDLILGTGAGEIRHSRPRIFQDGRRVDGGFLVEGDEVRFQVGAYDRRKPLVIDPVLLVNQSFGGSGISFDFPGLHTALFDTGTGIATDSAGNIYITGTTHSLDFPVSNALQNGPTGPCQSFCAFSSVFVSKLSPDGSSLLYSTYIGAPPSAPAPWYSIPPMLPAAIAVDTDGTAYVTGTTSGVNFPGVTATAGGNDAFLLRLSPQGALVASRLFGGSGDDAGTSIVLDSSGYVYLAGTTKSSDFPVSEGAYAAPAAGETNIFVVKILFNRIFGLPGGTLIYSAVAGPGTSASVAADAEGSAYIAGATTSTAWQTTSGAVQPMCKGTTCQDIVVAKLDPVGQKLLYATYLGGSAAETSSGIAVDAAGSAYVAGSTSSSDFPVTSGAYEGHSKTTSSTGFAAKLNADATKLIYATYLGGSGIDQPAAIAVDAEGDAYVGGTTTSADFPLRYALQSTIVNAYCPVFTPSGSIPEGGYACGNAGFLALLDPAGAALEWSTYLGAGSVDALALDPAGNVYATGEAINVNLPSNGKSVSVLKLGPGNPGLDVPANSIVNAASFAPGLPLPGGLASVFVRGLNLAGLETGSGSPLPTRLAGVSILVEGVPAPILAVAPVGSGTEQINFQVPFEVKGSTQFRYFETTPNAVEIRYQGASVFAVPPQGAAGIFLLNDGTPAIEHAADYSLVTPSNPAHSGEAIIVYLTGLGPVTPNGVSGVAAKGAAPVVTVCGAPYAAGSSGWPFGSVLYAGLTPGYVGLYQVNLRLPQSLSAGTAYFSINTSTCAVVGAFGLTSNIVALPVE